MKPTSRSSGCLFCGNEQGKFTSEEHILPKSLGNSKDSGLVETELVIPIGVICDKCNGRRLSRADGALTSWAPVSIYRSLGLITNRRGESVDASAKTNWRIQRNPSDPLEFRLDARGDTGPKSGIDNVVRALCKIAVELRWIQDKEDARSQRWDPLAAAAIGGPLPDGISMGVTQPASVDDVDLTPRGVVGVDDSPDRKLRMFCSVQLVSLDFLLLHNTQQIPIPNTMWWELDSGDGKTAGPEVFEATFFGRAREANRLPPDGPLDASRTSRLPTNDERVTLHIERPKSPPSGG